MSSFNLANKLIIPTKKAWKSFIDNLQSKQPNNILKFSKSIKKIRPFTQLKLRVNHRRRRHHYHHLTQKNSVAIYVDHLFPKPTSMRPNKGKEVLLTPASTTSSGASDKAKVEEDTNYMNINKLKKNIILPLKKGTVKVLDEAWQGLSLPQIRGVDERAEEFISKFRQDMKLQRSNLSLSSKRCWLEVLNYEILL